MNLVGWIITAVLGINVGVLVWALIIDQRAERRERLPDPAKTAGGCAGKSYTDTLGGFDFYVYPLSERDPEDL